MNRVTTLILGGGQGTRLFPLTKDRSKPAVPIGGKYRLIDIPITNSLRSGLNRIFIATQFNSESLNKHIFQTYRFDNFQSGFVNILAAEQTMASRDWYQGTADAVRKNLKHILDFHDTKYVLILSGDQIYRMDYQKIIDFHVSRGFHMSMSVIPVFEREAKSFGIMKVGDNDQINDFIEKPKELDLLRKYESRDFIKKNFQRVEANRDYLASMGIYLFNVEALTEALDNDFTDFGKEVIPYAIRNKKVGAYFFNGYWEDVGMISTFLQANLDFTAPLPKFNLYKDLIYTHPRFLPPSKIQNCTINEAVISEGSIIEGADIVKSVIGIRSVIKGNVKIENSLIMGMDYYESESEKRYDRMKHEPTMGIGKNTVIKNAIVDKNARIGENCEIINKNNIQNADFDNYYIRDYIVIIPKNAVIEDGTII